jgi:Tfp pilus assembly protein PilN
MRAVDLDFRKEPRIAAWAGIALLAAGALLLAASAVQYAQLAERLSAAEATLRDLGAGARKKPRPEMQKGNAQKVAFEMQRARDLLIRLQLPWNQLFETIESAHKSDVALLSIESDNDKRRVKIAGEAKNLDALVAYLRFLEERPALTDVYLESHEIQLKDPQRPVRFVLGARWLAAR